MKIPEQLKTYEDIEGFIKKMYELSGGNDDSDDSEDDEDNESEEEHITEEEANEFLNEFIDGSLYNDDWKEWFPDFEMVFEKGGPDEGNSVERVFHFTARNFYVKVECGYYSGSGYDFDDLKVSQVFPKEKMITVYE